MRMLHALALATALALAVPTGARATTADEVVARATFAVDNFLAVLPPDDVTRIYVQNAFGVMIFPGLIKGGFVIGAEHGLGVLLVRDTTTGAFGPPTFFEAFGGSFGLQIGAKSSDVIVTIMNERALERVLDGDMQLGGELSLAVMRVGGTFGAATTTAFGEDLYIFERTAGLFGGASLSGAGLIPQATLNESYWGTGSTPRNVARGTPMPDDRSVDLRDALLRF